ncbi:glycosyltransferase [Vibrio fluvialis]|nr:glycosyltransferase [Vibrio fluvialis]
MSENIIAVSVIVPIFNGEKYIYNCFNSLINQTLKNIEIILVDDASTDETKNILNNISLKYDNVKIVTLIDNVKQGGARNAGIKFSQGEYIAFVDIDDTVHPDMYRELYLHAVTTNAQVVDSDYFNVTNDRKTLITQKRHNINDRGSLIINYGRLWTKIFRKEMFLGDNGTLFPEGIYYEDNYIQAFLAMNTTSMEKVDKGFYFYWVGDVSTTRGENNFKIFDRVTSAVLMYEDYTKSNYYGQYNEEMEYRFLKLGVYNTFFQISKSFNYFPEDDFKVVSDIFSKVGYINNKFFTLKEKLILTIILHSPRLLFWYLGCRHKNGNS